MRKNCRHIQVPTAYKKALNRIVCRTEHTGGFAFRFFVVFMAGAFLHFYGAIGLRIYVFCAIIFAQIKRYTVI